MASLSRRAVARYIAGQLIAGVKTSEVMEQLAAYLIANRKVKLVDRFIADIEVELAAHGIVIADVTTARPLSEIDGSLRIAIESLLSTQTSGRHVALREHVDPDIIGGVIVRTAGTEYDRSLKGAVRALRSV